MANSSDPVQLAFSEANWSGSTMFAKPAICSTSRNRINKTHKAKYNKDNDENDEQAGNKN